MPFWLGLDFGEVGLSDGNFGLGFEVKPVSLRPSFVKWLVQYAVQQWGGSRESPSL